MGVASYLENIVERLERDLAALDSKAKVVKVGSERKRAPGVINITDPIIVDKSKAIRKAAKDLIAEVKPLIEVLRNPEVPLALQVQIHQKTREALESEVNTLRGQVKSLNARLEQLQSQVKFWKDQHDRLSRVRPMGPSSTRRNGRDLTSSSTRTPRKRGAG